jgi:hypothetical protein
VRSSEVEGKDTAINNQAEKRFKTSE